jgi:hypothetical protein
MMCSTYRWHGTVKTGIKDNIGMELFEDTGVRRSVLTGTIWFWRAWCLLQTDAF